MEKMNKKREKTRFLRILNSKPVIGALIFIMLSLATVIAGDVIVKEGDTYFDGDVGIGTATPKAGYELDVVGDMILSSTTGTLRLGSNDASYSTIKHDSAVTDNFFITMTRPQSGKMILQTGGANDRLTILHTGEVGIGTTSPDAPLQVEKAGTNPADTAWEFITITQIEQAGASYGEESGIKFVVGSKDTGWIGTKFWGAQQADGRLGFATGINGALTTHMVIDKDGNVGIGTASPNYPLQVDGSNGGISIYAQYNISATDYITRTSVFDTTKNVWNYIKDADDYLTLDEIDHSKFYGYRNYDINVIDFSRPVEKNQEFFNEITNKTEIQIIITYPYTKTITEEGVSLGSEVDLLRQAVYELSQELCIYDDQYSWC